MQIISPHMVNMTLNSTPPWLCNDFIYVAFSKWIYSLFWFELSGVQ